MWKKVKRKKQNTYAIIMVMMALLIIAFLHFFFFPKEKEMYEKEQTGISIEIKKIIDETRENIQYLEFQVYLQKDEKRINEKWEKDIQKLEMQRKKYESMAKSSVYYLSEKEREIQKEEYIKVKTYIEKQKEIKNRIYQNRYKSFETMGKVEETIKNLTEKKQVTSISYNQELVQWMITYEAVLTEVVKRYEIDKNITFEKYQELRKSQMKTADIRQMNDGVKALKKIQTKSETDEILHQSILYLFERIIEDIKDYNKLLIDIYEEVSWCETD